MLSWCKEKDRSFLGRENIGSDLIIEFLLSKPAHVKRQIRIKEILWIFLEFNISISLVDKIIELSFKVVNNFSFPSSVCFYRCFVHFSQPIDFLNIWILLYLCFFTILCFQSLYLIISAWSCLETEVSDRIFCIFNKTNIQITLCKFGT